MPDEKPQAETEQKRRLFGMKEIAALVLSLGVSVLILLFHEQLVQLQGLGYGGAFLIMLISSATVVLPTPGIFLIFALGGTGLNPLLLGTIAGLGSALGELTGYLAGYSGNRLIAHTKTYQKIERIVDTKGFWAIALLAFIPNPLFDVAGIAAGALKMHISKFLFATTLGKVLKTVIIAYAGAMSVEWIGRLLGGG